MRVKIIGESYPQLRESITSASGTITAETDDADALVVAHSGSAQQLLEELNAAPQIRWVQLPSAGIERFTDSLKAHPELHWTSAKGAYALPVGEHALALTLALLRQLRTRARAHSWGTAAGTSLHGLRAVVIGAGGVALETVRLLKCFDTHVTVVRRRAEAAAGADQTLRAEELSAHLPKTDVVILAAALTDATRGIIGAEALDLLPEHAVVVNVGRGGLIDTDALVAALQQNRLGGAALDVTDPEPLPDGHPLWDEPRALITPHTADTMEMIQPLYADRVAENITRLRGGEQLVGVVDPAAGY